MLWIAGGLVLGVLSYSGSYRATEAYFRSRKVPYPFEWFGIANGLGAMLGVWALLFLISALLTKGKNHEKSLF